MKKVRKMTLTQMMNSLLILTKKPFIMIPKMTSKLVLRIKKGVIVVSKEINLSL
jgi:hypothetical protein